MENHVEIRQDDAQLNSKKINNKLTFYIIGVMATGIGLAALISIVAILVGEWSDTVTKSLGTVLMMTFHALVAVIFLNKSQKREPTSLQLLLSSIIIVVIALSFFTSTLSIWGLIKYDLSVALFKTYFWAIITTVVYAKIVGQNYTNKWSKGLAKTTAIITIVLFLYTQPGIYIGLLPKKTTKSNYGFVASQEVNQKMPDLYYRGQASLVVAFVASATIMVLLQRMVDSRK